jgi:hypothetical protein
MANNQLRPTTPVRTSRTRPSCRRRYLFRRPCDRTNHSSTRFSETSPRPTCASTSAAYVAIMPLRGLLSWSLYRPGLVAHRETLIGFPLWAGWAQAIYTWGLLVLGAIGVVVARRRRLALWLFAWLWLTATATDVLFTPSLRYRLGGTKALLLLSAVAIDALWRRRVTPSGPGKSHKLPKDRGRPRPVRRARCAESTRVRFRCRATCPPCDRSRPPEGRR